MSIDYALYRNHLIKDRTEYAARVIPTRSATMEDIVAQMLLQGSTITRTDIIAVLEDAVKAIEHMLLDGKRVNFGDLVLMSTGLKGSFSGVQDGYDRSRHSVVAKAVPGIRIKRSIQNNGVVNKVDRSRIGAEIYVYNDLGSGSDNSTLTVANIGCIQGKRLSFDAAAADEGIYFVSASDNTETKVSIIQKNKPAEIVFLVPPALAAGNYSLVLRYRENKDKLLQVALDDTLSVS